METKSSKKRAQFAFLMAAFALILAITGFLRVQDSPGGGDAVEYLFEVGLPLFLFGGLLWHGFSLHRKDNRAV